METQRLEKIVKEIREGRISPSAAVELLRNLPYENLGFANIDHHRTLRKGFPEVIYGQSKTSEQILEIASRIIDTSGRVLVTRLAAEKYAEIKKKLAQMLPKKPAPYAKTNTSPGLQKRK